MKCIGCGLQCRCALQDVTNNTIPGPGSKVQLTSELLGTHVRFEVQLAVNGPLSRYPGGQW